MREIIEIKNFIDKTFKEMKKICKKLRKEKNSLQSQNNSLFKSSLKYQERAKSFEIENRRLKKSISKKNQLNKFGENHKEKFK